MIEYKQAEEKALHEAGNRSSQFMLKEEYEEAGLDWEAARKESGRYNIL